MKNKINRIKSFIVSSGIVFIMFSRLYAEDGMVVIRKSDILKTPKFKVTLLQDKHVLKNTIMPFTYKNQIGFRIVGVYSQTFYAGKPYIIFEMTNKGKEPISVIWSADVILNTFLIERKIHNTWGYDTGYYQYDRIHLLDKPINRFKIIKLKPGKSLYFPAAFLLNPVESTVKFRYHPSIGDIKKLENCDKIIEDINKLRKIKKLFIGPLECEEILTKKILYLNEKGNCGPKLFSPENINKNNEKQTLK